MALFNSKQILSSLLSQIASGSVSASVNINSASFQITSGSSTFLFVSNSGNVGIGTTTPTNNLDVNGTARVQDNLLVSKNQNAETNITVSNTTAGTNSFTLLRITSDSSAGSLEVGKFSSTKAAVKFISANDSYIYNKEMFLYYFNKIYLIIFCYDITFQFYDCVKLSKSIYN